MALARPDGLECTDMPSPENVRPWNLRRMGPLLKVSGRWSSVRYDHNQQLAVNERGNPVLDRTPVAGPPTAPTTPPVDGEDPPSSEDWNNDFAPDEPFRP
jgi:putative ATP-grasp target RiPP